jgi:hypothetical protein
MNAIEATKAYRSDLIRSLATAKGLLAAEDFENVSLGLRVEISRTEDEIESLRLRSFMGVDDNPIFPRVLEFAAHALVRFHFGGRTLAQGQTPAIIQTTGNLIITGKGRTAYPLQESSGFLMNKTLQIKPCQA